ncbi:MAG: PLP-dependent aminotransferase family protein, partial [Pseudomonadota bacterium]
EGCDLATYNLQTGPQGYLPLRAFIANQVKRSAGMSVTPDDVLVTSGSLQGMDLINEALVGPGDTVIIEEDNYGGVLTRLARIGAHAEAIPLDDDGLRTDVLAERLADLAARGITPRYIYLIPTVQNPTGTILTEARRREVLDLAERYDVPIFEDDCYADLVFDRSRPPALHAMDTTGRVAYLGSFSKSIAPALRVGYVVAPWPLLSRLLALKTDAGTGALEQFMLAEFCTEHFEARIDRVLPILEGKLDTLTTALEENFGTVAEFKRPKGGIFLWVKLPDAVDTTRLAQAAAAEGIAVNPGPEWSHGPEASRHIRSCFANPTEQAIRDGIAKLANVCFNEFGVPVRSANVAR